ncbi:MAG TPA: cupin domain-containing protein [Clostridia bacterium]|nr:cupin domain-containing protein [Clostridia bacterium]
MRNSQSFAELLNKMDVVAQELKDDGVFPNSKLPLVLYREAVSVPGQDAAAAFEGLFAANGWGGSWRNGIYPYHHYHSTAHEVLGVYRGSAKVQLGGETGVVHEVHPGDVLVIPAGVAHKNLGSSADFGVVGAYPEGQDWDLKHGQPGERPGTDWNIARVALPKADPVYGTAGPLIEKWRG